MPEEVKEIIILNNSVNKIGSTMFTKIMVHMNHNLHATIGKNLSMLQKCIVSDFVSFATLGIHYKYFF